jgi:hypothetical protein
MNQFGGSQKMATERAENFMSDITPLTNTETDESRKSLSGQENTLPFEPDQGTLFLFGENSGISVLTNGQGGRRRGSTVRRSAMKERIRAANLFDKRTRLLIAAGLVKGITPMSIRNECGAPIPDFVFCGRDGAGAEKLKVG